MKKIILAQRTSDWSLHLQSVAEMLNLFAPAGHTNYAKSARIYLQKMFALPSKYPLLHEEFFKNKEHTVRRTTKHCNGIWTDLAIEQTLIQSIKSRGNLIKGRGMTENV